MKTTLRLAAVASTLGLAILMATACGGQNQDNAADLEQDTSHDQERRTTAEQRTPAGASAGSETAEGQPTESVNQSRIEAGGTPMGGTTTTKDGETGATRPGTESGGHVEPTATPESEAKLSDGTPAGMEHLTFGARFVGAGYGSRRAIYHMDLAVTENSNLGDAYVFRGYAYAILREFDQALADFEKAIEVGLIPSSDAAESVTMAHYRLTGGRGGGGVMPNVHALRGYVLTRLGRHQEAVDVLQPLVEKDPDFAGTFLALAHYNLGNYRAAEETCCQNYFGIQSRDVVSKLLAEQPDLDVALKLNPDDAEALRKRGFLNARFGEIARADEDHRRADEITGENRRRNYFGLKQYDQIIEATSKRIATLQQSEPNYQTLERLLREHNQRIHAYLRTDQYDKAKADIAEVVVIAAEIESQNPNDSLAPYTRERMTYMLGLLRILDGDLSGGFALLCAPDGSCGGTFRESSDFIDVDGANNPWLHLYRGRSQCEVASDRTLSCRRDSTRVRLEGRPEALYDFNRAIDLDPAVETAYVWRAIAYADMHGADDPATVQYYEEALQLQPTNAAIFDHRATHYALAEDFEKAIEDVNTLLELSPEKAADLHFRRAEYHRMNGDPQKAETDYLEASELGYDQEKVREALVNLAGGG